MQLLVVRHAIATELAKTGSAADDARRPLTDDGRKKMARGAKGLRRAFAHLDVLAASPLVRAQQTAQILADAFGGLDVATAEELTPGQAPAALARWLNRHARQRRVAIVGHEPHLSLAVSWLLTGGDHAILELKKGAACLLDLPDKIGPGSATLLWAMRPRQLRALAR